jgi:hypothetical protein
MAASEALALERLLTGTGLAEKPANVALLSGPGAKLQLASALPSRQTAASRLPTGIDPLDRLISGGLPRGRLTELVGRRSSGRFSVIVAALASATSAGEVAALVDRGSYLDPQSAREAGVELERLLWARARRVKEALAAAEMLLSTGFALVAVDLGLPPLRGAVPEAAWVRLARAAEVEHAALLLATPYRVSGFAAGAVVRMDGARFAWVGGGAAPRLLVGTGSRLSLEREVQGSPRRAEMLSLTAADSLLPLPAAAPCHPERSEGSLPPRRSLRASA